MTGYNHVKYASKKWLHEVLTKDPDSGKADVSYKRNRLAECYKWELVAEIGSRGDQEAREVYESFAKNHGIDVPDNDSEAHDLVLEKLRKMDTWLIDKIYKERKERARREMIENSAVGDIYCERSVIR
jgi:hypothetical protein